MKYSKIIWGLGFLGLFAACQNTSPSTETPATKTSQQKQPEDDSLREQGLAAVQQTLSALSSRLQAAMQEGGPTKAVELCNLEAMPITDSLSKSVGLRIRRVSDKNRNPENAAQGAALEHIKTLKAKLANKEALSSKIHREGDKTYGYYPILVNDLCLKCHGKAKENIDEATLKAIDARYPNDLARGYAANELRGLWVVEFSK